MPQPDIESGDFRSREELLQYLEEISGRSLRTRDAIKRYIEELSSRKPGDAPRVRRWKVVENATWLVLLVSSFLQYYFLGVLNEISLYRSVTFFGPGLSRLIKATLELLTDLA